MEGRCYTSALFENKENKPTVHRESGLPRELRYKSQAELSVDSSIIGIGGAGIG
jgi:hypothetical protein